MLTAETIARLLPHDKALHILAGALCALAGLAGGQLLRLPPMACALAVCAVAAVARELSNDSGFSWPDIGWTLVGGGLTGAAAWVGS